MLPEGITSVAQPELVIAAILFAIAAGVVLEKAL
jgi:hypothetical protein